MGRQHQTNKAILDLAEGMITLIDRAGNKRSAVSPNFRKIWAISATPHKIMAKSSRFSQNSTTTNQQIKSKLTELKLVSI